MGWTYRRHREDEAVYKICSEDTKGKNRFGDVGVDARILLKWVVDRM
jgi:hypothetical protein